MSDPTLNYETPLPNRPNALRTATWISLLILGIFYCLGGLCFGGIIMLAYYEIKARPGGMPPGVATTMLITLAVILGLGLIFGISNIWAAFRVRRASKAATITALVIAFLNTLASLFIIVCIVVAFMANPSHMNPRDISILVMYCAPAIINGTVAILLILLLRQRHQIG